MTQFKKEVTTLRVNKLALAVALGLSLGLAGCGDDQSVSNAVGVPNPNALMPTGTIQGTLVDAVTNEPIVGAVVDIGIAKATTSETGQFVISNVPATTTNLAPAGGAAGTGAYDVTIDLRQVKAAASGAKYPDFSYSSAAVSYTTLADGTGASSNHATPVTGLVAPISLTVGKLAAGIKGVVAKTSTFKAAGAGYTVKLVSIDGCGDASLGDTCSTAGNGASTNGSATSGKGGTGANEHVVAMVTTKEDGAFSFEKIESLQLFRIDVVNADGTERGSERVKSPADDQIKTLLIQRGGLAVPVADGAVLPVDDAADLRTVFVSTTDTLAPTLLSVSPEDGFDVPAATGSVDVKFTFSEPIKATPYAKALTAASVGDAGGLYNNVLVNFNGAKAGNIPHTLAWNAAMTELTVTIPNVAKASKYSVAIAGVAGQLMDMNDVLLAALPAAKATINFSTNGAATPAAVTTVAVTNRASLNAAGVPTVDWLPVASAKSYNVYRAKALAGGAYGEYQRIGHAVTSDFADDGAQVLNVMPGINKYELSVDPVIFADNGLKVTYKYMVRPVSYDNVELLTAADGTDTSGVNVAQDNMTPAVAFMPTLVTTSKTVTVTFNEPMDEASAETLANYVLTARADDPTTGTTAAPINEAPATAPTIPVLSSVVYYRTAVPAIGAEPAIPANSVKLTYASNVPAGTTLTVTGVKDVAGNVMTAKVNPADATATNTASVAKVATTIFSSTTVLFSAEMNKASAETVANYTLTLRSGVAAVAGNTLPVLSSVSYAGNFSTLTYAAPTATTYALSDTVLTVSGVKDKQGDVADTAKQD